MVKCQVFAIVHKVLLLDQVYSLLRNKKEVSLEKTLIRFPLESPDFLHSGSTGSAVTCFQVLEMAFGEGVAGAGF